MPTVLHYPHILEETDRAPCLERWPRVRVSQIAMDHLGRAWSSEEIARQYPHLSLSEIHSALAYYFDHQEEIDQEIKQEWEQVQESIKESVPSPFYSRMKAKGLL